MSQKKKKQIQYITLSTLKIYALLVVVRPIYFDGFHNYMAKWNGETWQFTDPAGTLGFMGGHTYGPQDYPEDNQDWSYETAPDSGDYIEYTNVRICCSGIGLRDFFVVASKNYVFFEIPQ